MCLVGARFGLSLDEVQNLELWQFDALVTHLNKETEAQSG
tara:strand:+ start:1307 stop:1426 length:120 start_codon:yes stop_codon:yes gene_type:complete